jgi:hypothetical protein
LVVGVDEGPVDVEHGDRHRVLLPAQKGVQITSGGQP